MHKKLVSIENLKDTSRKLAHRVLPYSEALEIQRSLRRGKPAHYGPLVFLPLAGGNVYGACPKKGLQAG